MIRFLRKKTTGKLTLELRDGLKDLKTLTTERDLLKGDIDLPPEKYKSIMLTRKYRADQSVVCHYPVEHYHGVASRLVTDLERYISDIKIVLDERKDGEG